MEKFELLAKKVEELEYNQNEKIKQVTESVTMFQSEMESAIAPMLDKNVEKSADKYFGIVSDKLNLRVKLLESLMIVITIITLLVFALVPFSSGITNSIAKYFIQPSIWGGVIIFSVNALCFTCIFVLIKIKNFSIFDTCIKNKRKVVNYDE